jgi:hypothetical protein
MSQPNVSTEFIVVIRSALGTGIYAECYYIVQGLGHHVMTRPSRNQRGLGRVLKTPPVERTVRR